VVVDADPVPPVRQRIRKATVVSQNSSTTGRGALRRRLLGVAGAAATVAVAGALTLAAPLSASADSRPESYAKGQFLSGTVLGTDLARVLAAQYAEAHNDGTQSTQSSQDPFKVTALNAVQLGGGQSAQLGLGDFLQLGAIDQYAQAGNDGTSLGASGAVTSNGAIQTNRNSSGPGADATFDLSKLLGSQFASTLADLKLQLGAVAAQANGNLDSASGAYNLAGAKLSFTSPAVSQLTEKVDSAIDSVNTQLGGLTGQGGDLAQKLQQLLPLQGSGLNLLGNDVSLTATIDTGNLKDAVQSLLNAQYGDGSVSFDLETGVVTLDLAKLLGGKLNSLAPGTELIDAKILDGVLDSITTTVSTIADQVIAKVKDLLNSATVTITAHAAVSVAQAPIIGQVCHTVQSILPGASGSGSGSATPGSGSGGLGAIVGGLLGGASGVLGNTGSGGSTGGAVGSLLNQVTSTVCDPTSTPVAPKLSQLDVKIQGSAKQLIAGGSTTASISLKVLDAVQADIDANAVVAGLGSTLSDQLFGTDGAIQKLTTALQDGLVHPAVDGLVGTSGTSVNDAITKLLSVKVNLQETTLAGGKGMAAQSGKLFTETAVRVTVGGGSIATVNLAQASVGPNVTTVVPPTCANGICTPPTCTGICSGTNPPSTTPTASSVDRLATTGISIAALVAAMLALLAAGAYLVREGYKRKQLTPVG
jgi:hypothetical protein